MGVLIDQRWRPASRQRRQVPIHGGSRQSQLPLWGHPSWLGMGSWGFMPSHVCPYHRAASYGCQACATLPGRYSHVGDLLHRTATGISCDWGLRRCWLRWELDTRRSTTGYLFTVNGGAVSCQSKLQKTVSTSTQEAEYQASGAAAKEALWMRKLLPDLGLSVMTIRLAWR